MYMCNIPSPCTRARDIVTVLGSDLSTVSAGRHIHIDCMKGTHSHSSKDSANHKHGNVLCTGKDDGGDHEQRTAVPVPQNKKAMSANIVLHV